MAIYMNKKSVPLMMLVILLTGVGVWLVIQQRSSVPAIRHVVLISLDTCRADHLSCYGYAQPTTPHIDALAEQGTLFRRALTPIPLTLPAHASMLTGTIPPHHGKRENKDIYFDPSHVTLATLLKAKGFRTGAFVGAQILNGRFGLNRGFDTYHDRFAHQGRSERRAEEVNRAAFAWLEQQKGNPVFLFLHYYDPHHTYDPPEPFATTFKESPYAGEIAYTDHCIGQVVATLKRLGMYESSLIVVTGDHGEMLGEHGETTHMFFIYQSALKVPLVCKLPGSCAARTVDDLTSIIDIVPTICDLLDIAPPAGIQGKTLAPYFNAKPPQPEERYLYCESLYPTKYEANSLLGVSGKQWKFIQTTRPELYDLLKDPGERTNLVESQPHRARILKDRLSQILSQSIQVAKPPEDTPLDAESLRHLRSLGYVAGASVDDNIRFDQSREDPKDLIGFHNACCQIEHLIGQNKLSDARVLIDRFLTQRPAFVLYELALRTALKQKDYGNAVRYGEKAVILRPGLFRIHTNLGIAYFRNQQSEAAATQYELALEHMQRNQAPTSAERAKVLNALAWILLTCPNEAVKDPPRALGLAQKACTLTRSTHPQYLNTLAVAYGTLNQFSEALKICEKALALARARGDQARIATLQKQHDLLKQAMAESNQEP
jgi:arylsulfatase A-like enzyme